MKVLMLGWEYPPEISGGLGTACKGIVGGLVAGGQEIIFVAPRMAEVPHDPLVRFVDLSRVKRPAGSSPPEGVKRVETKSTLRPYMTEDSYAEMVERASSLSVKEGMKSVLFLSNRYGPDLAAEVERYARALEYLAVTEEFDIVHAHDWMTFPAALHLKGLTGVPLVLHVHSLELDRNPDKPDGRVLKIEKGALKAADHVIAVSFYTKDRLVRHYGVPEWKITVVHNAVSRENRSRLPGMMKPFGKKIVLYLGRVTSQKGPEYFIDAAARVIKGNDSVWFVMAGSGDMLPKMIERAAHLRISRNFHFTGFLRGPEVERMYAMSDVYVMPSVSEPFGISGLEAILYDVPVIVTKGSGVGEVLRHAFKVDPGDVNHLANTILAVLRYPALRGAMVRMCRDEIAGVCWERAAERIENVYTAALGRR